MRQQGFSLLELLVAVAVFAAVSAVAYSGLQSVMATRYETRRHAERLEALERTMLTLQRDLSQVVVRPVRDQFGDEEPAFSQGGVGEALLSFTRAGRANPLGLKRSGLRRIAYVLEEGRLERHLWSTLDHSQGEEPYRLVLIDQVDGVELRYLDAQGQWLEGWPPLAVAGEDAGPTLPRAIEITLELERWGPFRRLIPLPAGLSQQSLPAEEEAS